jgi:hypothetical protein
VIGILSQCRPSLGEEGAGQIEYRRVNLGVPGEVARDPHVLV